MTEGSANYGIDIPSYRVKGQLGRGGMATVYLAEQVTLGREVALKVMAAHLVEQDPSFTDRFMREARIVAQLAHPHIVAVYDIGEHDGHNYISMEYHNGGVLKSKIQDGMDVPACLQVIREVASALSYAHGQGFIHRDIKPDNILFRHDGGAVLMDFGIARAINSDTQMTVAGSVVGTPHYMSPEQAMGATLDHRSDIYALGVVLYEMLVGEVPFAADTPLGICMKHVNDPPPPLPEELVGLQPLLDGMLEKTLEGRFQTAADLVEVIRKLEHNLRAGSDTLTMSEGITFPTGTMTSLRADQDRTELISPENLRATRRPTMAGQAPANAKSRTGIWLGLTAVLLALAGGGGWYALQSGSLGSDQPELADLPTAAAGTGDALNPNAQRIRDLLATANAALASPRQAPPGRNPAWAAVQDVLALDPGNSDAIRAQTMLGRSYQDDARTALAEGDSSAAATAIEHLQTVHPDNSALADLQQDLASLQRASAQDSRIAALISTAREQIRADQLSSPAGNNATETLAELARLAPGDRRLTSLRDLIGDRYANLAAERRSRGDLDGARAMLERGREASPGLQALATESSRLETAVAEQRRASLAAADAGDQLNTADQHLAAGRLTRPPGNNAWEAYGDVLARQPGNRRAANGRVQVRAAVMQQLSTLAGSKDIANTLALAEDARRIGIPSSELELAWLNLAGAKLQDKVAGQPTPELVFVPAGSFRLGDLNDTGFGSERPVQQVNINEPFLIGRTEVTFAQYDAFAKTAGRALPDDSGWGRGQRPVINLTLEDALAYTDWLSQITGQSYQLPTEAQWEYAARAGASTDYPWGNAIGSQRANCRNCGGDTGRRTLDVGSFSANTWGLLDVVGNVYEWTASPFVPYAGSNAGQDRWRPGAGRVVARGGSWFDADRMNRMSMRLAQTPDFKSEFIGFRVVRVP